MSGVSQAASSWSSTSLSPRTRSFLKTRYWLLAGWPADRQLLIVCYGLQNAAVMWHAVIQHDTRRTYVCVCFVVVSGCVELGRARRWRGSPTEEWRFSALQSSHELWHQLPDVHHGTPLQNSLRELWSLLHFIMPLRYVHTDYAHLPEIRGKIITTVPCRVVYMIQWLLCYVILTASDSRFPQHCMH